MNKKKKILVLYYSQTGQLKRIVDSVIEPLNQSNNIEVILEEISSTEKFDFPWSFFKFFDVFPECISLDAPSIHQPKAKVQNYDLIIFAYQVWFLSPSLPTTGFLQSNFAKSVFKDTPVITLIGCRNMWLMAQEKIKKLLNDLGAKHIDNIVLTDRGGPLVNLITVPRWELTGSESRLLGVLPKPGISDKNIAEASRFGTAIIHAIKHNKEAFNNSILKGYKAVEVDDKIIFSEKAGYKVFTIWAKVIRKIAPRKSKLRYPFLVCFALSLVLTILVVVPIPMLIRTILAPITKGKTKQIKKYYESPSGADDFNLTDKNG